MSASPWESMDEIIFQNPDFTEEAILCGFPLRVIDSEISEDGTATEFGLDEGVGFFLRFRIPQVEAFLGRPPAEGDDVVFRNREYRISSIVTDSAGICCKAYLRARSGK